MILAFQHKEDIGNYVYEIMFSPMNLGTPINLEGQSFEVDDRTGETVIFNGSSLLKVCKVARRLQMALTGHDVSER